jgi:aldose 1-epimerase
VPSIGGSIAAMRFDDVDVMRPLSTADRAAGDVLGVASFPMLPYANRIAGNAFVFDNRRYEFAMNNPPEIYNVHGTGWRSPWTVAEPDETSALLTLEVLDADAPYSFRAAQRFRIDSAGIEIGMRIENAGPRRMPFGFGHHPWFERDADTLIEFNARTFHLNEPEGVIGTRIALPAEVSYASPAPPPRRYLCSDYGGWDGLARLRFPARGVGLTIRAEPVFGHLMFYADPARSVFCLEPQTNASGAFNRENGFDDPEEGVIILAPGEAAGGTLRFEPYRIAL